MSAIGPNSISVSPSSRYVGTPAYSIPVESSDVATGETRTRTATFFGTWSPPNIVERRAAIEYIVTVADAFRPELISYRVYSDKSLFWAIALRNGIIDVFESLKPGTKLMCPHPDDIATALLQASETRPSDL